MGGGQFTVGGGLRLRGLVERGLLHTGRLLGLIERRLGRLEGGLSRHGISQRLLVLSRSSIESLLIRLHVLGVVLKTHRTAKRQGLFRVIVVDAAVLGEFLSLGAIVAVHANAGKGVIRVDNIEVMTILAELSGWLPCCDPSLLFPESPISVSGFAAQVFGGVVLEGVVAVMCRVNLPAPVVRIVHGDSHQRI